MEIRNQKIRLKITGKCNQSCFFCHEEGDMKGISDFIVDQNLKNCLNNLRNELGIKEISLTGGEPLVYPQFKELCEYLKKDGFNIKLTTNGTILNDWKNTPVDQVTISIHSVNPDKLLKIEKLPRKIEWAKKMIENRTENLKRLAETKIKKRVNMVVVDRGILKDLEDLKKTIPKGTEIRLLNNLNDLENSNKIISDLIKELGAKKIREYRRDASSNHTAYYTSDQIEFSTKISYPFFFNYVCDKCPIKNKCNEGFYGLRLEKKGDRYLIRLCLYRSDKEVLMPYEDFLKSDLKQEYLKIIEKV